MNEELKTWKEIEKELNITSEQETEIQLEMEIIKATIEARKKCNLSQRELGKKTGIQQPVIARIESRARSPQVTTLLKILYPMGYTLKVVPIKKKNKQKKLANYKKIFQNLEKSNYIMYNILELLQKYYIYITI